MRLIDLGVKEGTVVVLNWSDGTGRTRMRIDSIEHGNAHGVWLDHSTDGYCYPGRTAVAGLHIDDDWERDESEMVRQLLDEYETE